MADRPRQAAGARSPQASGPADAPAAPRVVRQRPVIPERYALREKDGVRFLECDEAPRLRAIIDPEMAVSRSEAASLGERVILLDGAGSFGPTIDTEHKLYNLDHHEGCERLFTLATCEQALLLVHSGLELSEGDWTLYANDPDLDTVLAVWCLLNHRRVRELRDEARDVLLPLFRLEGAIDAHGAELAGLCGLPSDVLERTRRTIDDLLVRERSLKQTGSWATKNAYAYTLEMLRAVDLLVYEGDDFGDDTRIEEVYGHVEIAPRRVAVACRDRSGIYAVEQHLKSRWGDQLGIIALENQPGRYTLRRLSSVTGPDLEPAYALLNRVDPAVDGRPPGKRWGGSRDIGGSPRPAGTRLGADEVLALLHRAYASSTRWARVRRVAGGLALGLAFAGVAPLAGFLPTPEPLLSLAPGVAEAWRAGLASLVALLLGMGATRQASQRRPWVFGWRAPANGGGAWLAPVALLGALPAAAWAALAAPGSGAPALAARLAAAALGLAAAEVWFRGLVHGLFALDHPVQRPGGDWQVSRAAGVSTLAWAAVVAGLSAFALTGLGGTAWSPARIFAAVAAGALPVGLALAALRERTLSLLPGLGLQLAGLVAVVVGLALGLPAP